MSAVSPVETFSFSTALELLKQGSTVRRSVWPPERKIKLEKSTIMEYGTSSHSCHFLATNRDLLAVDWQETTPILDAV